MSNVQLFHDEDMLHSMRW